MIDLIKALADPASYAIRVDSQTGEIHIERIDVLQSKGARIVNIRART